jgi:hypothetical protein
MVNFATAIRAYCARHERIVRTAVGHPLRVLGLQVGRAVLSGAL